MRSGAARAVLVLVLSLSSAGCSRWPGLVQAEHARQFGCEARWVRVEEIGPEAFRATGCGFQSSWQCSGSTHGCAMQDHAAYGVGVP